MAEAAKCLGVSVDTIRRRLHKGELQGYQQPRPQGFVWVIEIPEEMADPGSTFAKTVADIPVNNGGSNGGSNGGDRRLEEVVAVLQAQVTSQQRQMEAHQDELTAKNKQIEQLHILLQQAQAALPAPKESRHSWWRFWQR